MSKTILLHFHRFKGWVTAPTRAQVRRPSLCLRGEPAENPAEFGYFVIQSWWVHLLPTKYLLNSVLFSFTLALVICGLSHTECQRRKYTSPVILSVATQKGSSKTGRCMELDIRSHLDLTFLVCNASGLAWVVFTVLSGSNVLHFQDFNSWLTFG